MKSLDSPILLGLPDLCAEILSFFLQLRKVEDPGDPEDLRRKIDERFRGLESEAREKGIPEGNVALAKYALAALIDETILTSRWEIREGWSGNPLQLEYFNDFSAGEEFYNKLEHLRHSSDPGKLDVLEVYFLCLALGFKGKYGGIEGMEKIRSLLKELAEELRVARGREGGRGASLSPEWEPPDQLPAMVRRLPAWAVGVGCAALLLLIYVLLSAILGGKVNGILETLK